MDGVGIPIIETPRPLHNHETPNPANTSYTLTCEETLSGSLLPLRPRLVAGWLSAS